MLKRLYTNLIDARQRSVNKRIAEHLQRIDYKSHSVDEVWELLNKQTSSLR